MGFLKIGQYGYEDKFEPSSGYKPLKNIFLFSRAEVRWQW